MKRAKPATTTQAVLEDLLRYAVRACGADPTPYLARFRKAVVRQMNFPPDPLFIAEVEAAKREIAKNNENLRQHAVNGMISVDHVMVVMEKVIQHNSRFRDSQAN